MFPSMIVRAINLDVISNGMGRTRNGALQVACFITVYLLHCATIGTILQIYKGSLLQLVIWVMLIVGAVVSVLALSLISATVAWITLAMWAGIFTVVAYDYVVPQTIIDWIN